MPTVIQQNDLGHDIGSGLGQGLSEGLQQLASRKIQKMHQKESYLDLKNAFPDLPEGALSFLSSKPPKEQQQYLQQWSQGLQALQSQQEQQMPQAGPISDDKYTPEVLQKLGQYIQSPQAQQKYSPEELQKVSQNLQKMSQGSQQQFKPNVQQQPQKLSFGQAFSAGLKKDEQKSIDKETLPIYEKINKSANGAEENDKRLDKMDALIKKGNLPNAQFAAAIKSLSHGIFGFGIDLTSLLHADAQEFDKLSTDFLKNISDIFPGRILKTEIDNYLKTIPNLSQTDEGKKRVISNLREFNQAMKIRKKAMNDLIRANGGKRPANLDTLVDELSAPQINKISDNFKRDVEEYNESGGIINDAAENAKYLIGLRSTNPYKQRLKNEEEKKNKS